MPVNSNFTPGQVLTAAQLNAEFGQAASAADLAQIQNGTATDAGTLTGAEVVPVSRGSGLLQTAVSSIANYALNIATLFTQGVMGAISRTILAKLLDFAPTITDFNGSTGASDNSTAITNAINTNRNVAVGDGTYQVASSYSSSTQPMKLRGAAQYGTTLKQTSATNPAVLYNNTVTGSQVSNLSIDVTASGSSANGHPIDLVDVTDATIEKTAIVGLNGTGSGVLVWANTLANVKNVRMLDMKVTGNPASANNNGVLITNGLYCQMHGIYADGISSYAVEYKNATSYSTVSDIIGNNSQVAFGMGWTTGNGVSHCAVQNIVSKDCAAALEIGQATYNVFTGFTVDIQTPWSNGVKRGVSLESSSNYNSLVNFLFSGQVNDPIHNYSSYNYVSAAVHTTGTIVTLESGARNNVTAVTHPGTRTSIASAITNNSGFALSGPSANPVYCHATGEYFGIFGSNWLWQYLSTGLTAQLSAHKWVYESTGSAGINILTDGTGTNGYSVAKSGVVHSLNYVWSDDHWQLDAGSGVFRFYGNSFYSLSDNSASSGLAGNRWSNVFSMTATLSGPIALQPAAAPITASTYSQTTSDAVIRFNGSANQTITLLAAATYPGRILKVKNESAFTLVSASSNVVPLVGGSAGTAILAVGPGKWAELQSDGTNWNVISGN